MVQIGGGGLIDHELGPAGPASVSSMHTFPLTVYEDLRASPLLFAPFCSSNLHRSLVFHLHFISVVYPRSIFLQHRFMYIRVYRICHIHTSAHWTCRALVPSCQSSAFNWLSARPPNHPPRLELFTHNLLPCRKIMEHCWSPVSRTSREST